MGFFGELFIGIKSYNKALKFTNTHKLWGYYIIPALINLIIVFGIGWVVYNYRGDLSHFLERMLGIDDYDGWWGNIIQYLLNIFIYLVIALVFFKIYKYIILTLLSPILSMLAEKTQVALTGQEAPPFQFSRLLSDIGRGIRIALRNLVLEIGLTIGLLFLSLFPVFAPFTTILLIVLECYFLGFSMLDYHYEFKQVSAKESMRLIRKHKGLAIGNGFGLYLIFFIPIIGLMFGPLLSVVSAGLSIERLEQKQLKAS